MRRKSYLGLPLICYVPKVSYTQLSQELGGLTVKRRVVLVFGDKQRGVLFERT